jgi:indolepyruvate decarboxylase
MNIGQLLLVALKQAGVREIFGIPGDFVLPLFKVIEESAILPLFTLSHEPSVGFAADGAARATCRPSAAVVTYGAGALNMVNPIAAAYAERVPVVVVSGGPGVGEQPGELLLHHQAKQLDSQFQIYKEITCAWTRLDSPADAPGELSRVISECICQSRPVYIEIPRDLVTVNCGDPLPLNLTKSFDSLAMEACLDELLERMTNARSPVLMVGVEIRRLGIETQVAELARLLSIPVVTSFMGRGLLANHGVSLCGTYMGVAGASQLTDLVEDADALFLLGVILSDTNLGTSRRKLNLKRCIVAQDGTVSMGYHQYPEIPLAALVDSMIERLAEKPVGQIVLTNRTIPSDYPCGLVADLQPIVPDDVATAVNDWVKKFPKTQIVADVGDSLFVAMDIAGTGLAAPGYYASMGYAIPAGLGIQVATGERPLIIVGDGAFQMTGWELGNCARYGWDPIVIVLNNSGWEMLRAFQPEARFNNLDTWRFADLANALAGEGVRVQNRQELNNALAVAFERQGKFQLIEVMVARGKTSRTMSQFVQGIAARQELKAGQCEMSLNAKCYAKVKQ